ncbi:hypothetical protein LguiB_015191 [Lonicera macranthoides]
MGEIVVSSEGMMDLEVREAEPPQTMEDSGPAAVVRWEKFLPRMALRVLLVEADDSTRQIIAALLRKCSYKVAAVSDGLKAWEVLKGRPQQIDLILTEVELPSISGYALLTLIAEHEICKNIPVIMMSSIDSVSTVYKCMLRGAADFLVKPLRKNELRNLWQHVWRRQASASGGNGTREESDVQQKVEATAENNATSNHSSGYMACLKRNRECIEKGSDAQSSCTKMSKPDLEAEGEYMENMQDLSQPKWSKSLSGDKIIIQSQKHTECTDASQQLLLHDGEAGGSGAPTRNNANMVTWEEDPGLQSQWERTNDATEACDNDQAPANSSREAIDLIGTFDNYPKCSYRSLGLNDGTNKVDYSPLLDLSLRRSHPSGSVNQAMDEGHRLKQSNASAFSRYINRTSQALNSTSVSICNQQNEYETYSDKQVSNHALEYNSDNHGPSQNSQKNMISKANDQSGQGEIHFPSSQRKVFPVPVPVRGIRFDSLSNAYGSSVYPQMFCTQSGLSPMPSPGSSGPQGPAFPFGQSNPPETRNSQNLQKLMDQNAKTEQLEQMQGRKQKYLDDRGNFSSSANDQSATSSFCNGNVNLVPVVRATAECGNDATTLIHDGNSNRATHREAALNKFRMKRKDRCYEKKVRYESRKKLAEQRPRVKGQFVRQVNNEPPPVETDNSMEAM